jgi:hypothetical protein
LKHFRLDFSNHADYSRLKSLSVRFLLVSSQTPSPILVLTCGEKDNVQCCFANTIESKKMVNQPNFIGVFDKSMDLHEVKSTIKTKIRADYGKS